MIETERNSLIKKKDYVLSLISVNRSRFSREKREKKISLDMRVIVSLDKMAKLKNYGRLCRFPTLSTRDIVVDTVDFYNSRVVSRIVFSIFSIFSKLEELLKSYRSRYSIGEIKKSYLPSFFNFSVVVKGLNVTVDMKLGVKNNTLNISNLTFNAHLKEFNVSIVMS